MSTRTLLRIAATVSVPATLLLSGCGGSPQKVDTPPATSASPSASASPSSVTGPSKEPTSAEPTSEAPSTPQFGETYSWDDGLEMTVSKPTAYKPSPSAAGTDRFKNFLMFQITIKNGSKEKFEPGPTTISVSSGDEEGQEVFDYDKGIESAPSTSVRPGRSTKWKVAFAVKDPKDLTMDAAPDFTREPITFTS